MRTLSSLARIHGPRDLIPSSLIPTPDPKMRLDLAALQGWAQQALDRRQPRPLHLWLHGETGLGKSFFVEQLSWFARLFYVPMDEDFYDGYEDGAYDLAVFEEMKAQKKVQWLNKFLDPAPVYLRVKGSQVMKTDFLPCIFLSNLLPHEAYHHLYALNNGVYAALRRRLLVVSLVGPVDFDWYPDTEYERWLAQEQALEAKLQAEKEAVLAESKALDQLMGWDSDLFDPEFLEFDG